MILQALIKIFESTHPKKIENQSKPMVPILFSKRRKCRKKIKQSLEVYPQSQKLNLAQTNPIKMKDFNTTWVKISMNYFSAVYILYIHIEFTWKMTMNNKFPNLDDWPNSFYTWIAFTAWLIAAYTFLVWLMHILIVPWFTIVLMSASLHALKVLHDLWWIDCRHLYMVILDGLLCDLEGICRRLVNIPPQANGQRTNQELVAEQLIETWRQ
jgi:hypothetical protein